GCRFDDGSNADRVRLSRQEHAAADMSKHSHIRIAHRRDDAICHGGLAQRKGGVNGGDHVIKLRENFVWKVERSIAPDITLDAGEEVNPIVGCVVISYTSELRQKARFIETVCLNGTLAVIGNAQVLHPQFLGGGGYLFKRGPSITVDGVAMKSSPEVRPFN